MQDFTLLKFNIALGLGVVLTLAAVDRGDLASTSEGRLDASSASAGSRADPLKARAPMQVSAVARLKLTDGAGTPGTAALGDTGSGHEHRSD